MSIERFWWGFSPIHGWVSLDRDENTTILEVKTYGFFGTRTMSTFKRTESDGPGLTTSSRIAILSPSRSLSRMPARQN